MEAISHMLEIASSWRVTTSLGSSFFAIESLLDRPVSFFLRQATAFLKTTTAMVTKPPRIFTI